jgi:hypothetical protein
MVVGPDLWPTEGSTASSASLQAIAQYCWITGKAQCDERYQKQAAGDP